MLSGFAWLGPSVIATAHPGEDERLAALHARIHAAPHDPSLRLRRAELLVRSGHHRRALAELARVERLDPDEREVLRLRALVHEAQGHPRRAERELDRYLDDGPPHVEALVARARIRDADGRLDAARDDLDAAIALGPTPELLLARGRLDERRGHLDDAARGYRRGLAALGPAVTVELALAHVELRRDAPALALEVVDELLARSPERADWILLRADVLEAQGLAAAATVERLRALVIADANLRRRPTPLHRLVLARAQLALELTEQAHAQLDRVLTEAPELPAAIELRARLEATPPESP